MLLLNHIEAIHWAYAGGGIAAVTLLLQYLANKNLGISTAFENVCALVIDRPYFNRRILAESATWRLPFVAGLVLAGVISAVQGGGWQPTWQLGMFDQMISTDPAFKVVWMFVGGIFIGLGTRLAGGCTSGHGIFGLATFQKPSLFAVIGFMLAGIVTTNLIYRVLL